MLISHTPKPFKGKWRTPIEVFRALDAEFNFKLDAAADKSNALCKAFLTEQQKIAKCGQLKYLQILKYFCNGYLV
ncbi:DNA N-6-adenine-methyltransferase [Arsenophonus sp.]|uniref:DNA N-6-adenine-methyltransferase n=1 Tax=Arsenophonus sp. TaxID=1872640 RepID=UPI0038796EC0